MIATVLSIDVLIQEENEGGEDDHHHLGDSVATAQVFLHHKMHSPPPLQSKRTNKYCLLFGLYFLFKIVDSERDQLCLWGFA